jgi:hypothetical protein
VVDELTVRCPRSGTVQMFHNVAAIRIVEITECQPELVEEHNRKAGRE